MEFAVLFIAIPLLLFFTGTRLYGAGIYAFIMLWRMPGFSWHKLWHGDGWAEHDKRQALIRFLILAAILAAITAIYLPERLMRFPLDRFWLWLAVMVLYPILSIIPQEICYRSFYFQRFGDLDQRLNIVLNGLVFGFSHIVLNNWIAPSFCAIAGALFGYSYLQHRSLKWAVIEHSLYGCWVFTVGIGWYFFTGNWRH